MTDERVVSAADLIAHNVLREWHEAVALVQEVCDHLARNDDASVPDAEQIHLRSDGEVVLLPSRPSSDAPAARLGYVLSALIEGIHAPAELRLLTSQLIGAELAFTAIGELSRRLTYFERPDRRRVLQLLYERAVAELTALQSRLESRPAAEPAVERVPAPKPTERSAWLAALTRRRKQLLATGAVVVVAAVVLAVEWPHVEGGYRRIRASAVVNRTSGSVEAVVASGLSSARDLLSKAGLVDPPSTAADSPPDSTSAPTGPARRRVSKRAVSTDTPASSTVAVPTDDSANAVVPAVQTPPAPAVPAASVASVDADADLDLRVYTRDDEGVEPPVLLSPQLPTSAPPDGAAAGPGLVEVLINQRGIVDAVKFLTPPGRYQERMLLSALKAWRYRPATKDGRPVRFSQRVKLTV